MDGEQKETLEERPSSSSEYVTIKSGDTLWGIAQQKLVMVRIGKKFMILTKTKFLILV